MEQPVQDKPLTLGHPAPQEIGAEMRVRDLFAVLSFNLLGVQARTGAVNWEWMRRILDQLETPGRTAELALLRTCCEVLAGQIGREEAVARYERARTLAGQGRHQSRWTRPSRRTRRPGLRLLPRQQLSWSQNRSMTSTMDARTWLETLPSELAQQQRVLLALLDAAERDPRWRWLELGCSVAQRHGDVWSDLDLGLGVAEEAWPAALDDLATLLGSLGEVVDILRHHWHAMGGQPHQRIFVQYDNGVQIDLVAVPANLPKGRQPENVILYDPDALRTDPWPASILQADAATVHEWAFLGWIALTDLAKYLRRGSLWEALERLEQARTQVWRLWAVSRRIRYPLYGVTAVLDHPEAGLPPGIEATVAGLDRADLLRAGVACADLLWETSIVAAHAVTAEIPDSMGTFVRQQLEDLDR